MSQALFFNWHRCIVFFLLSMVSLTLTAQLDKLHYIPPFFAPQETSGNVKDHWIVLSTQESETFVVTIKRGTDVYKTFSVSKVAPRLVHLGSGFSTDSNPTGIVNEDGLNKVLEKEGFMLEAEKPFFAAIYQRSNSQGDVLTCKGQTALGVEFYSGHIFGAYGKVDKRAQFLTVMATFDNTQVTFSNPRVKWDGQGSNTFTITLNKNESYALGGIYANAQAAGYEINDYNGTKVTSSKPIAVNSGAWMGSANLGGQQDIGIDQLVPQNFVGKKYIVVSGYGTSLGEKVIVVATRPNTELYVNDTLEHTFLQSGEYYVINSDEYNVTTHNMSIESTDNIYVYQTLSGKNSDVSVGMCFIPPLSCLSNREVNISYADKIGAPMLNIISELGSDVTINGQVLTKTPQPVVGNPDWVTFRLDADDVTKFSDPPSTFEIVSSSAINVALAFQDGAIGGAGFYSGFGVSPQLLAAPAVLGTEACYPNNAILQADGYDSYIWYYNNEVLTGETASSLIPNKTGQYRVSGTTSCGTTKASDPFILKTCLSMDGGGAFMEDEGDIMVKIRLGLPSEQDVEYWYRTVATTATDGVDFVNKSGVGTIPAGRVSDSISIELLDDDKDELGDESFVFELYFAENATVQNSLITFTITDNDPTPTVELPKYASVEENGGHAFISVVKTGESQESVSVNYYTQDIGTSTVSAKAGSEYEETLGTLTFAPDEYVKQIEIPIIDNDDLNDARYFSLFISDPVNAETLRSRCKISIYDNEEVSACLSMSVINPTVYEGDSIQLYITTDIAQETAAEFSILMTHLSTDTADVDTFSEALITFKKTQTDTTLWLKTIDDTTPESDEILSFEIADIKNAKRCSPALNVTILNNDYVPMPLNDNFSGQEDHTISGDVLSNDVVLGDTPVVVTFEPPAISWGDFDSLGEGVFSFTPKPNFFGGINFSYWLKDSSGDSTRATVLLIVEPENDVPIAINDTIVTDEDIAIDVMALANDLDIDGTGLSVESVYDNKLGDITLLTGYFTYSPKRNANGSEVIRYQIIDTEGDPSFAYVHLTIRPVNDAPIANADSYRMDEDAAMTTFDVLQNDEDQDKSGLDITRLYNVVGGDAVLVNNKVEFTLDANFWGNAHFSYTIEDGEGDTAFAEVDIAVLGANDFPQAIFDSYVLDEDKSVVMPLLANDVDDDQRGLSIVRMDDALYGEVQDSSGVLTYSPSNDFCGLDSFRYFIEDWNSDIDFSWVKVYVNCINEAPRAFADTFVLTEDGASVVFDLLQNDLDPDGSGLTINSIFGVTGGVLQIVGNTTVAYTLDANFYGDAGFSYSIKDGENDRDMALVYIKVLPSNDKPIAINDTVTTNEDMALVIDFLANDKDVDSGGLLVDTIMPAKHGDLDFLAGVLTYSPEENYCGQDSFAYIIADAQGDLDMAAVYITVVCVNESPTAIVDSVFATEDSSTVFYPLINDLDPDAGGLSVLTKSDPIHGTFKDSSGFFYYKSDDNFNGLDSLSYTIADAEGEQSTAWVIFTVIAVNDYPIAVNDKVSTDEDVLLSFDPLSNDIDVEDIIPVGFVIHQAPKRGSYEIVAGQINYKPEANLWGQDTMTYVAKDSYGALSTMATIVITVDSVNENPLPVDISSSLDEDMSDTTEVLAYAFDPDFSGLSLQLVSDALHGRTEVLASKVVYRPYSNYYGADTVTYTVVDGEGDVSTAQLYYNVISINDVPVAVDDSVKTDEDVVIVFWPTQFDTDIEDAEPRDIAILQHPKMGDYLIEDLSLTYTPWENRWGYDTMTYTVKDKEGAVSNVATIYVEVVSINESPIVSDIRINVDEDNRDTIDVMLYAESPDFSALTLHAPYWNTAVGGASPMLDYYAKNGQIEAWNNQLIYRPDSNYYGPDSLYYSMEDGEGDSSQALLMINVLSVNDAPVAMDDYYANVIGGVKDSAEIILTVSDNDTDVDEFPVQGRVTVDSLPLNGSVLFSADGLDIIYTPDSSFVGYDSLCYRLQDTLSAASNQAWVTIFTDSFNYAPRAVNDTLWVLEDKRISFNPMANDWDMHNDSIWPTVNNLIPTGALFEVMLTPHGFVELYSDTLWVYQPNADFYGKDSSYYQVNDALGAKSTGKLCFEVQPVNDVSELLVQSSSVLYVENSGWQQLFDNLAITDIDSDTLFQVTLSVTSADQTPCSIKLEERPWLSLKKDSSSTVSEMIMTGTNATVGAWVQVLNTLQYSNTSDDDTLTRYVELVVWDTPTSPSDTLRTRMVMNPINDLPYAIADSLDLLEDASISFNPLANDWDIENDSLWASGNNLTFHGSLELRSDTLWIYYPNADFYGKDSSYYQLNDAKGGISTAKMFFDVAPVNDAPELLVQSSSVLYVENSGWQQLFDNLAITDIDSDTLFQVTLSVTSADQTPCSIKLEERPWLSLKKDSSSTVSEMMMTGTNATVGAWVEVLNTLQYSNTSDDDTLTRYVELVVWDTPTSPSDTLRTRMVMSPINDLPYAIADSLFLFEDENVGFNPLANDWDIENDSLWASAYNLLPVGGLFDVMLTPHGSVELRNETFWVYHPNADFYGKDTSFYQLNDAQGGVATAKLFFDVRAVNDAPELLVQSSPVLYVENSGWQQLFDNLAIIDIDSDTLFQVTLSVTSADQTPCSIMMEERPWLSVTTDSSSTVSEMTMIGVNATVGAWVEVLNTLQYTNVSDDDTLTRYVELVVWDRPSSPSDTLRTRIVMDPINDAPQNSVSPQLSGVYLRDSVLSCDTGIWVDLDGEISYCFQWHYAIKGEVTDVFNSCASTLHVSDSLESADSIWCEVWASDNGYPPPSMSTMVSSNTLVPANYRPEGLALSQSVVYRTAEANSSIGLLIAEDRDSAQLHTYELLDGLGFFKIDGDTLKLDTAAYFIAEEEVHLRIRVSDNGLSNLSQVFTIHLELINDLMPLMSAGYPVLKDISGENVAITVQSTKPGKVLVEIYSLEDKAEVIMFEEDMLANTDVVLAANSLISEVDYMTLITFVDTSGHHFSETYQFPFRTLDTNGPQFYSPTPQVISAGVDSAVIAVRLDEPGELYYKVYESDTMFFADSISVDNLVVYADSLDLYAPDTTYYFTIENLNSQTRYDLTFFAVDTIDNSSEITHIQFSTNDTIAPHFMEGYPVLEEMNGAYIQYSVHFTEGGTVLARLRDNYQFMSDFSVADKLGIYDVDIQVSENSLTFIKSDKLPLDGLYLLDILLMDSAGNTSEIRTIPLMYPIPLELELLNEVIYLGEDVAFKKLNDVGAYSIYNLNGDLLREGIVSDVNEKISFDFTEEGLYLIHFSTFHDSRIFKVLKVNAPRP